MIVSRPVASPPALLREHSDGSASVLVWAVVMIMAGVAVLAPLTMQPGEPMSALVLVCQCL